MKDSVKNSVHSTGATLSIHAIPSSTTHVQNPGAITRVALLNDLTAFGRCSLAVALPVISSFGIQACPIPTAILSNHLGFPTYSYDDYSEGLGTIFGGLQDLGVAFDAISCGFLGSAKQIPMILSFLRQTATIASMTATATSPNTEATVYATVSDGNHCSCPDGVMTRPLFLLDPVMGDHGQPYATIDAAYVSSLRELAMWADILTPNLTEACLLTGTPYIEDSWNETKLTLLCEQIETMTRSTPHYFRDNSPISSHDSSLDNCHDSSHDSSLDNCHDTSCDNLRDSLRVNSRNGHLDRHRDHPKIVITGLQHPDGLGNYVWENHQGSLFVTASTGDARPGTGDLFAAVLLGAFLRGASFEKAVQTAASFVARAIAYTQNHKVPTQEGVLFEPLLPYLHEG
ncbi:MAG: bifunctional hydroxymethylpyrimidine kinase/phosphomethylpyrimidine kinase [Clostridium sp.]|jgi:pyridoxine kinase|nr:bifunctional hydroxymethylpyrimidine kinase/phosphomethylpyrimidine kinase [Clostridium sp.]